MRNIPSPSLSMSRNEYSQLITALADLLFSFLSALRVLMYLCTYGYQSCIPSSINDNTPFTKPNNYIPSKHIHSVTCKKNQKTITLSLIPSSLSRTKSHPNPPSSSLIYPLFIPPFQQTILYNDVL